MQQHGRPLRGRPADYSLELLTGNDKLAYKKAGRAEASVSGETHMQIASDSLDILHKLKEIACAGYLLDRAENTAVLHEKTACDKREIAAYGVKTGMRLEQELSQ